MLPLFAHGPLYTWEDRERGERLNQKAWLIQGQIIKETLHVDIVNIADKLENL